MRYTRIEIDPFTVLGVVGAGVSHFSKCFYYCAKVSDPMRQFLTLTLQIIVSASPAMSKQAMGTIGINQYEQPHGWFNLHTSCLSSKAYGEVQDT
jgi:hypothetical protein